MADPRPTTHLSSIPLFAGCTAAELAEIAPLTQLVRARAGREIVKQGSRGEKCFILVEGSAGVTRHRRRIATLGPGEAFGELALVYNGPRSASVVTDTDVQMLVLKRSDFLALLESSPSIARKLLQTMAARLVELDRPGTA